MPRIVDVIACVPTLTTTEQFFRCTFAPGDLVCLEWLVRSYGDIPLVMWSMEEQLEREAFQRYRAQNNVTGWMRKNECGLVMAVTAPCALLWTARGYGWIDAHLLVPVENVTEAPIIDTRTASCTLSA